MTQNKISNLLKNHQKISKNDLDAPKGIIFGIIVGTILWVLFLLLIYNLIY